MSIFTIVLAIIGASQVYWAWRGLSLARRRIAAPGRRMVVIGLVLAVYLVLLAYNLAGHL